MKTYKLRSILLFENVKWESNFNGMENAVSVPLIQASVWRRWTLLENVRAVLLIRPFALEART